MNDVEVKPISDIVKDKACEQFVKRRRYAVSIEKIDNAGLHAGSPMYFYCRHCGIPTEVLPEDYLFPSNRECSQCQGLQKEGWLDCAKKLSEEEAF